MLEDTCNHEKSVIKWRGNYTGGHWIIGSFLCTFADALHPHPGTETAHCLASDDHESGCTPPPPGDGNFRGFAGCVGSPRMHSTPTRGRKQFLIGVLYCISRMHSTPTRGRKRYLLRVVFLYLKGWMHSTPTRGRKHIIILHIWQSSGCTPPPPGDGNIVGSVFFPTHSRCTPPPPGDGNTVSGVVNMMRV